MLIDAIAFALARSGALEHFWDKLDRGTDATLGVASSARPTLVAARFAAHPQSTLVVVAGEDAAVAFARNLATLLGEDAVLRFPEREDVPWKARRGDPAIVARRMEAVAALATARPCIVVASARALVRRMAPPKVRAWEPLLLTECQDVSVDPARGAESFEDLERALASMGYLNTGQLEGPGTFCSRGGAIDVYPGNLPSPVRLDFFGDELDEIRRIVPSTGQTIASLRQVDIYPVTEYPATP